MSDPAPGATAGAPPAVLPERLLRLAASLLEAYDRGTALPAPSQGPAPLSLAEAYALTGELIRIRQARGERMLGRKIGFTNRTIWARYGVHAPIWGAVWDTTVTRLDGVQATTSLAGLVEPRVEPEIVFGLRAAPRSAALDDVAAAIDWVAHGFEIVQSLYPGWRFAAADTVAAFGLHGRLYVGPPARFAEWPDAARTLSALEVTLNLDGRPVDHGSGSNVLDGPVQALAHLVSELARQPGLPPLAAGDIVTTGTITDAAPLAPGQTWSTTLVAPGLGGRLPGLTLHAN